MQNFTNKNSFDTYRSETKDGREYLVVKGVSIVEGVLNKFFVPMDEFGAFTHDWNGVPLVLRHPKDNNGSARVPSPDVPVVGNFYSASLDKENRRLLGEYWFDKMTLLASDEGKRIHDDILAGKVIETSTGYYANIDDIPGVYNGYSYIGVQHGIHPDHIAVLPDDVGACSIRDGCGINRNSAVYQNCGGCSMKVQTNVTGDLPAEAKKIWESAYDEAIKDGDSEEDAAKKAWGACKKAGWEKKGDEWVKADEAEDDSEDKVTDNTQAPSQDNWLVKLFSNPKKEKHMDKFKTLVQKILNEADWSVNFDEDQKTATAIQNAAPLSETLTGLESIVNEAGGAAKFKDMLCNLSKLPASVQALTEKVDSLSGGVEAATVMAQNAAAKADADKTAVVGRLIANTQCPFDEATLNGMTLGNLEKLEVSYRPTNYAALGGPVTQNAGASDTNILTQPSMMDFFPAEKEKVN